MIACASKTERSGVDMARWNDWKWQLANRITTTRQLKEILNIPDRELDDIAKCLEKFRMSITPYYASLIDPDNPDCPIRKQCIPSSLELQVRPCDMADPLGEGALLPGGEYCAPIPGQGLVPADRQVRHVLQALYKEKVGGQARPDNKQESVEKALDYIRKNSAIRDVLLSGGDPLILSDKKLESIISRLRRIPHVEIVRIGTRVPVTLPMRITDDLLRMLRKYHPIWINTHFNHPKEITEASAAACEKIVDAGIPLATRASF